MKYIVTTTNTEEGYEDHVFRNEEDAEEFRAYAEHDADYSYVGEVEKF